MYVAVFGGSFDPPHVCHVLAAAWALAVEPFDRVLAIPCLAHPLGKELAPFRHRLEMARRAFAPFGDRVGVSAIEGERPGPSRTLDTLCALKAAHPDWRLRLLAGSDILAEKHQWHRFEEVEKLAPPLIIGRAGHGEPAPFSLRLPDVSSSEIRSFLAAGRDVTGLVPLPVLDYVREHSLYASPEAYR